MLSRSLLRVHPRGACCCQIRFKTALYKPKIARTRPLKTPSAVALDHFDFYYGPMFGKRWPSIRLGLLGPTKYIAAINTFSKNHEVNEDLMEGYGATDLLAKVRGKTTEEKVEGKRTKVMEGAKLDTEKAMQEMNESKEESVEVEDSRDDPIWRSEAGMGEYQQPSGTLTRGELQMGNKGEKEMKDFEVNGFEGEGVLLPKRQHFIYYPKALKIYSYDRGVTADYPPPIRDDHAIPSWWLLDGGSLVPILALGLEQGDSLLDVCAAPGGKSLLALLTGLIGKLVCNDFKLSRLGQLKRSLSTYIPADSEVADKVILKRKDAGNVSTWDEIDCYDKVLADVPCTTDRLAVSQDEGNLFSPQMSNMRLSLPQLQTKILINALRAVKVGGSVVYSTCTLSSIQNEAVVENAAAIASQKFGIKIVEESLFQLTSHLTSSGLYKFSDQCKIGALVLPFLPSNFGPMYICKLTRIA